MSTESLPVTIRPAREGDAVRLRDLATLDSAAVPAPPILVAEIDGTLVAAVGAASGEAIADPFVPTSEALELLTTRARRLHPRRAGRPLGMRRRRHRAGAPRVA